MSIIRLGKILQTVLHRNAVKSGYVHASATMLYGKQQKLLTQAQVWSIGRHTHLPLTEESPKIRNNMKKTRPGSK